MKWRKKSNSAWAIIVPEFDDFSYLPLTQIIGKTGFKLLLELNLKWQKENLTYIIENLDIRAEFLFYVKKNSGFKNLVKKEMHPYKCIFKSIPNQSHGFSFKKISDELMKSYEKITIWNLEAPVLSPLHLCEAIKPNRIYSIKNSREGLILVSYNLMSSEKEIIHDSQLIPSLYDLESIREIISYMYSHDNPLYEKRSEDLSQVFNLIRQNPD